MDISAHGRHLGAWGLDPQPNTLYVTSVMRSACLRFELPLTWLRLKSPGPGSDLQPGLPSWPAEFQWCASFSGLQRKNHISLLFS